MADGPHGMAPGHDGDDDELVEIELEELTGEAPGPAPSPTGPPGIPLPPGWVTRPPRPVEPPVAAPAPEPAPTSPPPDEGEVDFADIVEVRQPIVEAAEIDLHAERTLIEHEAAAATEASGRAALLLEVARLREGEGDLDGARAAARDAFDADPSLAVTLWGLRRLLSRGGHWDELAAAYRRAADSVPIAASGEARAARTRADLLVERGRLLEDRLQRDADALASYEEALAVEPDHAGALLALLLAGARLQHASVTATALGGLARRADGARRAALAIEEARAWRQADDPARAIGVLTAELARGDQALPIGTLLGELDALTAPAVPEVAVRALAEIAGRAAAADRELAIALWRERARLQAAPPLAAPADALASLDEAARLGAGHPAVAAARLQLVETLSGAAGTDALAPDLIAQADSDDQAVDLALLHAELALRGGREEAARASLAIPRVHERRGARADLRALELVLAIRARDAGALQEGFVAEADQAAGKATGEAAAAADALVAAGAIRQWRLDDAAGAEALYRRALDRVPTHTPATHALVDMLVSAGRAAEAAAVLEKTLTWAADVSTMFEVWAREKIVSIYVDELADEPDLLDKAAEHQRRLVELTPKDVERRIRLADIEMCRDADAELPKRIDNLLTLADLAGDPAVAIALKVEAGRMLIAAPGAELRRRGETMLAELVTQDASGLAALRARACAADGGGARGPGRQRARGRRNRRARRGGARAAVPPGASLRGGRTLRRGDGGADAPPLARAIRWRAPGATSWRGAPAKRSSRSRSCPRRRGRRTARWATKRSSASRTAKRWRGPATRTVPRRRSGGRSRWRARVRPRSTPRWRCCASPRRIGRPGRTRSARRCARSRRRAPKMVQGEPKNDALATGAAREAALVNLAAGQAEASDAATAPPADAPPRVRADLAVLRLLSAGEARRVARGGRGVAGDGVAGGARLGRLLRRHRTGLEDGPARARGRPGAARWERRRRGRRAACLGDRAPAGAGVRAVGSAGRGGGAWPDDRPDPRRARARRNGGAFGVGARSGGGARRRTARRAGTALAIYGSVIAADPERLEAWTGIRRVARAGGDVIGEARALARLGAVVRDPGDAAGAAGGGGRGLRAGGADRRRDHRAREVRRAAAERLHRVHARPTSCCAPIWTRPGGRCCSTRCCRTGWPRRR